ncbi:hypothetical protein MNBD_GAMMA15-1742 [hydrothermal vent metagenome]|uniref:Uncharacterized protein n=1 Tax=hydrothermal vent metagenome TaxID=652676 RepID=A0A3B0YFE5_9ZZZZ
MAKSVYLFLAIFLSLTTTQAYACRCNQPSMQEAYDASALVVQANVSDFASMPSGEGNVAILKTKQTWKGQALDKISVISLTNCHFSWEVDKQYIVFLHEESNGMYSTDKCMGNVSGEEGESAVRWLEENSMSK